MFYSGADPVTLLDDLRELGQAHITAHADLVPPLASLEAEHCYLWWEILLVTDRNQAAIKDVFVFVEDECEVRIRLLEDQSGTVALLGSVPADAFELFKTGVRRTSGATWKGTRLRWRNDPEVRDNLDSLFRGVHSIKGNAGLLLGHVTGAALTDSHPLQLLVRVAHGAGVPSRSLPWSDRRPGVGRDDPNRAGGLRRDPHSVGEPHAQRRGRTGLAGTARAFGRAELQPRRRRPARGRAGSRVSQYRVTVRRDDR